MAIARKNALGRPNHPVEHYRKAFQYLVYGSDPLEHRIDQILSSGSSYHLKYFGNSAISEIVGNVFAEEYVFYNKRDLEAIQFLGIHPPFKRGDSLGKRYVVYNESIKDIKDLYTQIVGKRSGTTIPLEVDQFFSWLYENYVSAANTVPDFQEEDYTKSPKKVWKIAPGSGASEWPAYTREGMMAICYDGIATGDMTQYGDLQDFTTRLDLNSKGKAEGAPYLFPGCRGRGHSSSK